MRILSISSQVIFGPVGNSAAVPAMQALGHEVLAVPTVILSNHPGHGRPAALRMPAADLAAMLGALEGLGALDSCAAVMTGYFTADDQIHGVARTIRRMQKKNPSLYALVDPVIGDGDRLYVPLPVAEAIRDELLPLADCASPNRFELEWLTGWRVSSISEARAAAARLAAKEVLATSIPAGPGNLATLAIAGGDCFEMVATLRKSVPHGTGDFLAGLYLAHRLAADPQSALRRSTAILDRAIAISAGSTVLDIAGALQP
jgi:pyridoxine kinase